MAAMLASSNTAGCMSVTRTPARRPVPSSFRQVPMPRNIKLRVVADAQKEKDSPINLPKLEIPETKVDPTAPQYSWGTPVFSRRREVWVGRMAMFGFVAAVLGEARWGDGPIHQIMHWTGLGFSQAACLIGLIIGFNFIGGLNPFGPTWSKRNQEDVRKRPVGPVQDPGITLVSDPKKFAGVSEFGFTKTNEVIVGRLAMLGFFFAVLGEVTYGNGAGPLGQIGIELPHNGPLITYGILIWTALNAAAGYFLGNFGEAQGGEDVY